MKQQELTGYLFINKPKDITSFQCVSHIKRILKQNIKIGHAGTLDPFATGLLIIGIGRQATKLIDTLLTLNKEYIVTAKLGELTDTLDHTGNVVKTIKANIKQEDLEHIIKTFEKTYIQVPPIYSALKYQGKPLYKLARNQILDKEKLEDIIKQKSRTVTLYALEFQEYKPPYFTFKAHVSKGTYIRSLANDIAKKLGTTATTYELERTKIGPIQLAKAVSLHTIKTIEDIEKNLINIEALQKQL